MTGRSWTECFAQVPGAEYFMQLKRPQDITYQDYFRYRKVQSSQREACDQEWINTVLETLRRSGNRSLEQEYSRLDRSWRRDAAQYDAFWSDLRAKEIKREEEHLDEERTLFLKRNVVQQLNTTIGDYTRRTEENARRSSSQSKPNDAACSSVPSKISPPDVVSVSEEIECTFSHKNVATSTAPLGSPPHTEESETMQMERVIGQIRDNPTSSTTTAPLQDSVESLSLPDTLMESVYVGQKHPRDRFDDDNTVQTKHPRNRASSLPEDRSQNEEHEDVMSDDAILSETGLPVQPALIDQVENTMSDEVVLLTDTELPAQPTSFDQTEDVANGDSEVLLRDGGPPVQAALLYQAEDAKSNNRVLPDLPVQPALFNQVGVTSSRTSLTVTITEDLHGQHASGIPAGRNHKQSRRRYSSSSDGRKDNPPQAAPPSCPKILIDADLPSSDPGDSSFSSSRGLYESTSRVYSWNYLEGNGRLDSSVNSAWRHNDVDISRDLMDFRQRVVQENGGLNHPHQKLAVNFVFLLEGDHRTKGLHLEMDDKPWAALCEVTREHVDPLLKGTVDEALQWVEFLSQESPDTLKSLLRSTPPIDPSLWSILNLMSVSGHLWNSEPSNEDSFLKSWLGPFLSTYLGSITFTTSAWTHTQEETRNMDFSRLVPDFATVTATLQGELSLVLLEGKVATNKVFQIWDDKTKLGQEMKLALDSILVLSPEDDVCVVGILVREPLVEFFSMKIHAEGCYIMRRFAICHIPTDHENMVALLSMMKAFQHVVAKVTLTLAAIRRVRVRPSQTPKVPFSWLRPSFSKPTKMLVRDG
ncbi:hypothetical protein BGX27_002551, partial [Mortierella sp. AM989]